MELLSVMRVNRAVLARVIADGQDVVEPLAGKLVERFRAMMREIHTNLSHYGDRFRTDDGGAGAGAVDFELVASVVTQKPFGHLAARGVRRTEDQHPRFGSAHEQHPGGQQAAGLVARMKALRNLPSIWGA